MSLQLFRLDQNNGMWRECTCALCRGDELRKSTCKYLLLFSLAEVNLFLFIIYA